MSEGPAVMRAYMVRPGYSWLGRLREPRLWRCAALAIRLGVPLAALLLGGPGTFVGIVVAQELAYLLVDRVGQDRAFSTPLFLGAYGVRVLFAIALYLAFLPSNGNGAVVPDEYGNDMAASWLLRIIHGEGLALFTGHKHVVDNGYPLLLTGLYALVGYAPLLPKLLGAVVGALVCVLVAEIGRRGYGTLVGRLAGTGAAIVPGLVFWSGLTLKEMLVLLGAAMALAAVQALLDGPRERGGAGNQVVVLALGLALLLDMRAPVALFVLVAGVAALAVLIVLRRPRLGMLLGGVLALVLLSVGAVAASPPARPAREAALSRADAFLLAVRHRRAWEAYGARTQLAGADDMIELVPSDDPDNPNIRYRDDGPVSWSRDIVEPLAFSLFAPVPWQARSPRDLAASVEMPVWYALLAGSLLGVARSGGRGVSGPLLAVYGLLTVVLLATTEGNVGNLLRHRILLAPTLLVLGSAGFVTAWDMLRHRRSVPARTGSSARARRLEASPSQPGRR